MAATFCFLSRWTRTTWKANMSRLGPTILRSWMATARIRWWSANHSLRNRIPRIGFKPAMGSWSYDTGWRNANGKRKTTRLLSWPYWRLRIPISDQSYQQRWSITAVSTFGNFLSLFPILFFLLWEIWIKYDFLCISGATYPNHE